MDLNDAVALVTGGSEGIGRAIAERLIQEGAVVTITGRREDVLAEAAGEMGAEWIEGDVGVEADAVRTVASVVEKHGRLDILVNNAGIGLFKPLIEMELEDLEKVYRTNVFGAFLMGREAARRFVVTAAAIAKKQPKPAAEATPAASKPEPAAESSEDPKAE